MLHSNDNSPIVYPCLEANNIPEIETNVVTEIPLYSFAKIFDVRILVDKQMLDTILKHNGNIYIESNKKLLDYASIASYDVIYNSGSLVSGLHCNRGAEQEQLWNMKKYIR